ncbi:MAG: hypothetical protein HY671_14280 [Chloroflexi bacterium]|nr:hypothetical protein [Chloroflexota bacterium]
MRKFKFVVSFFLAAVLIVLPEPVTTGIGVALLSWAIIHYLGLPGPTSGTCRCDYCRMGLSKLGRHSDSVLGGYDVASRLMGKGTNLSNMRRAQATLPLTRGRGYIQANRVQRYYAKGGVGIM